VLHFIQNRITVQAYIRIMYSVINMRQQVNVSSRLDHPGK